MRSRVLNCRFKLYCSKIDLKLWNFRLILKSIFGTTIIIKASFLFKK